jgi:1-acyl-sn-glycerol-3-phosphate acyltransferase
MLLFKRVLRSIYLWVAIALLTTGMYIVGLPLFLITMPFDRKRAIGHWYAQRWGRMILRLNPLWTIEVRGNHRIPPHKPLVVISNHQGVGDIMMSFCLELHFKWISKASNFYVPFMGWFMFHAGYIPLVRGNKDSIVKCMARAREYLDQGVSVLFFPEGTRSKDGEIQPFKQGAFRLAIEAGCDILPVAITGTCESLPKNTWLFPEEKTTMKILVGDTIPVRGYSEGNLDQLVARCRETVVALKDELDGRTYDRLRAAG